jgi:8-oxo-dGTP pyrophosphatase MutT (NUDIX family)
VDGALHALKRRMQSIAHLPDTPGLVAFFIAGQRCGRMHPDVARDLAIDVHDCTLREGEFHLTPPQSDPALLSRRLEEVVGSLIERGHVPKRRGEMLDLRPATDAPAIAVIDRCAVRSLGIRTYSVHLNGWTLDGRLVVAKRAAAKRVDPGLWDNVTGGMISAGESAYQALVRESMEEAGLHMDWLAPIEGSRIPVARFVGEGLLDEIVRVFDVELPEWARPVNHDGEVECFETLGVDEVLTMIDANLFTVEASLATIDSLERRSRAPEVLIAP